MALSTTHHALFSDPPQLAAGSLLPPDFCLDSQTAGVPNESLPFHQPILHLTTMELAHCIFPEMWGFSINSLCSFLHKCVSYRDVTCKYGDGKRCNWTNHAYELLKKKSICVPSSIPYIYIYRHTITQHCRVVNAYSSQRAENQRSCCWRRALRRHRECFRGVVLYSESDIPSMVLCMSHCHNISA